MLLKGCQCLRKACLVTAHRMAWGKGRETVRGLMWDCTRATETQETERCQEGAEWSSRRLRKGAGLEKG